MTFEYSLCSLTTNLGFDFSISNTTKFCFLPGRSWQPLIRPMSTISCIRLLPRNPECLRGPPTLIRPPPRPFPRRDSRSPNHECRSVPPVQARPPASRKNPLHASCPSLVPFLLIEEECFQSYLPARLVVVIHSAVCASLFLCCTFKQPVM